MSAVENAQQKAREVGQLLGQSLGPPLLVKEEEAKEWRNEGEEEGGGEQGPPPLPRLPHIPTVTAHATVSASFSFRDKSRKKV